MKSCGILAHITSLPGPGGIGTMGPHARDFALFLANAGHRFWQILPSTPAGLGNSPYSSYSVFAGNPLFISPELLEEQGLLLPAELEEYYAATQGDPHRVDYERITPLKHALLHKAYSRFSGADIGLNAYCNANSEWLEDYALFMALRTRFQAPWQEWPEDIRQRRADALERWNRELSEERAYWRFTQFIFHGQWAAMKAHVNSLGIRIIGDIPIYVAMDSADVWADNGALFQLDERKNPAFVAGVPPDAFSKTGQLWGNPLYNWEAIAADGYAWWVRRVRQMTLLCDMLRLDHFRGFDAYYAVPAGDSTAENGAWQPGPGIRLFDVLRRELREPVIIAEDLGVLTDSVRALLARTGYPGMKILEFAFDSDWKNPYLPYNYASDNCVCYTGTHDNDTALGWWRSAPSDVQRFARKYLCLTKSDEVNWKLIRAAYDTRAVLAVIQLQDCLGLGSEARMNRPGVPDGNWEWRAAPGALTEALAKRLYAVAQETNRLQPTKRT